MKSLKHIILVSFLLTNLVSSAQQETYDVVTYSIPKGWQKQQVQGGVQLFVTDNTTGGYAIAIITQSMATTGSASDDFNSQWKSLLVNTVNSITQPKMEELVQDEGWEILTGTGNYVDRGIKGLATLVTATGGQQTAAVVLMTNTQQYESDLLAFINSLSLKKPEQESTPVINTQPSNAPGKNSIVGLWYSFLNETSGYINNMPQYTAGYFRKEYTFNANGTYEYRLKNWSVHMKDIQFAYETGTWVANGTKLTLTPSAGRSEWWSKAPSNRTNEWGKLVKPGEYKLEKQTYTFNIEYFSGSDDYTIVLRSTRPTQRDGGNFNAAGEPNEFRYTFRKDLGSLIDNPPGFKVGNNSTQQNDSPLTGKTWEAKSNEKYPGGSMNPHTGGYTAHQYVFNANGTYRFVYVGASAYTDLNILKYESGTYTLNGNQLTLTPTQGNNEEWSVVGGPVKLSGMSDMQVRKIKESWNKRVKSTQRKLEKNVYTFRIEYLQGNEANALILEYNRATERESNGTVAYYFETPAAKAIRLPDVIK